MINKAFGSYARRKREAMVREDQPGYSVRKLAARIGVEPSYVSKIERGDFAPPGEDTIIRWSEALGENPDVMLALAGKVSSDLREAITKRPELFAELIRTLKNMPDSAVVRVVREVRDGNW